MNLASLSSRMLLGRLLTRSGDQAWDFAVPIVLLQLLPGNLRFAALYYLLIRIATVLFLPRLSSLIDHIDRLKASKLGILLQLIGVLVGFASVIVLARTSPHDFESHEFISIFIVLVASGIVSQLGSTFMDISIANDLVPSSFDYDKLAAFNSRLRQVDLFTEVGSPVLAGALLLMTSTHWPLLGFSLIAIWNVLSFFPEYGILKSIFNERPDLKDKPLKIDSTTKQSIFAQIRDGWSSFFRDPIALVVLAYSFLWLSVLSPHGVLLTAYLKDGWNLPELTIGIFRGLGALFGLLATVLFPLILRRVSVNRASFLFLSFQAVMLVIGYLLFLRADSFGQIGFLVLILFSRVGLYGFSLGEMQIRQTGIGPQVRGEVNGFANALTALATIGLYGAGVALPSTEDFKYLVLSSVGFVVLALVVYGSWYRRQSKSKK
ncbi:MAG: ABC transporter substrate-binding protein [Bdellovibrionaceae bacterium]|nr:ABC transporter substrate-binding protein [Pseudobdellovibrionaceae bacterium]